MGADEDIVQPESAPENSKRKFAAVRKAAGRLGGRRAPRRLTGGRDLPVAIAVGVGLLALVGGAVALNALAVTAVIWLLTSIAYAEVRRVLRSVGRDIDVAVLVAATLMMLLGAYQAGHAGQIVGIVVLVFGGFLWHVSDSQRSNVVDTLAMTSLFGVWVGYLASYAVLLIVRPSHGQLLLAAVVGAAIVADIGAFAVGVKWGRHKIAPTLSPNKTWEGLIGGVVSAVLIGVIVLPNIGGPFTVVSAAVVVSLSAVAAFLGDLVESMVKRDLGVKDLGEVLPGHGGILDRVDGILFALPVGYYAVEMLM